MAEQQLLPVRPFPQLQRRSQIPTDLGRALYARAINNELCFKLFNRRFIRALRQLSPPELSEAGNRVVRDLQANGIALAHFREFFGADFYSRIKSAFLQYLEEFERQRPAKAKGKAVYIDTIHKAHTFIPDDVASAYCSTSTFAAIAAGYMGMVPRFVGNSFWRTRPSPNGEREYSQLWHRDYNDRRNVKAFLYVSDVGKENGYIEYLTSSHAAGSVSRIFDSIGGDGFRAYPDLSEVDEFLAKFPVLELDTIPENHQSGPAAPWHGRPTVVRCIAPEGSLIFADTFGLHRGGHVVTGYRDMIMTTYSTNFNVHKPHFSVTKEFAASLSPFMKVSFGLE